MVQKIATAWVVAYLFLFCHASAVFAIEGHFVFGVRKSAVFDVCHRGNLWQVESSSKGSLSFQSDSHGWYEIALEGQTNCSHDDQENGNLIQNGHFEQPVCDYWELEDPRGQASFNCSSDEARINVRSPGEYYEVQFKQSISLMEGQWYRLRFQGRSSVRNIIPVGIINPADYDSIGLWVDCDLHLDERDFAYLFKSSETISNARFSFYIGEHQGNYFFDNVEIVEVYPNDDCFRPYGDLITNGNFECDNVCQHGWRFEDHPGTGFSYCEGDAASGIYSALIQPGQTGEYYETQLQQLVALQEGQSYELSFAGKTLSDPQTIVVELVDPQSFINRGLVFGPVLESEWTFVSHIFTASATGTARLGFNVGNWGPDTPIWIDQISLRPLGNHNRNANSSAPSQTSTPMNAAAFTLSERNNVNFDILDVGGRSIASEQQSLAAGNQTYIWDGLQRNGRRAPSGIYFIRITSAGLRSVKRIVMVR